VNNLGVGLHSFGFTEGVWGALYGSWMVLGVFLLMGVVVWFRERGAKASRDNLATPKSAVTA
jgi:hypothetical protein